MYTLEFCQMDPLAIGAAAQILGLSAARVRAMAAKGQLGALKVGDRWLVERSAVEARRRRGASSGRPFAPHNAWALLLLASGQRVDGIDPTVRSRLRRAIALDGLEKVGARLGLRAESRLLQAHPGELKHLLDDPAFLRTGISAAGEYGLDLLSGEEADGYLPAERLTEFTSAHALAPKVDAAANVRVRLVPDSAWWLLEDERVAPIAAVALDLAEDPDPRSSQAGTEALRKLA
jgi:excisionase family DNA binding protein